MKSEISSWCKIYSGEKREKQGESERASKRENWKVRVTPGSVRPFLQKMATKQGIVGDRAPQAQAGLEPGGQMLERGLRSPKAEEASESQRVCFPANLNGDTEEFQNERASTRIKEEEEGPAQPWESQWPDFPKEQQTFHVRWGDPRVTETTPWGHSETLPPHFQGAAKAGHRPRRERANQLLLGLCKESQGVDNKPLTRDEAECKKLDQKMILDEEEETVGTETHRQHFRGFRYLEAEGPREVCSRLWFFCYQWLKPERHSKEQILELLILEQFLAILPSEIQNWVKEHSPETCTQAVALAEDFLTRQEEPPRVDCETTEIPGVQEESIGSLLPLQHMEKVVSGLLAEVGLYSSKAKGTAPGTCQQDKQKEQSDAPPLADPVPMQEKGEVLQPESSKKEESPENCMANFGTRPDMAEGDKMPPSGLKPHKCSECGKRFHQISHLNRHLRIHTGEKPYKCLDCGKSFTQGSCLLGHQRIHTGEKAYSCSYCSKSFIWSSGLHQHEKIHLGEKPYKCLECGKSFHRSSALTDHVRSHTGEKPYTCSDCGKGFSQHSNLIVHRRVHTGEKPYTCSVCGKSFTRTALLMAHLRIHTGEKPYKCLICERSFRERPALTKHKKIHMRENL